MWEQLGVMLGSPPWGSCPGVMLGVQGHAVDGRPSEQDEYDGYACRPVSKSSRAHDRCINPTLQT